jgi:hypothetical protein
MEGNQQGLFCDFYPLTPYSYEDSGWFTLQFNTSEKGTGFVEIIRRTQNSKESPETDTMNFKL